MENVYWRRLENVNTFSSLQARDQPDVPLEKVSQSAEKGKSEEHGEAHDDVASEEVSPYNYVFAENRLPPKS
jgi:hypothetical protein